MPEALMTPPTPLNRPDWFDRHLMIRFPVRRPTLFAGDLSASAETPLMHELALHNASYLGRSAAVLLRIGGYPDPWLCSLSWRC